MAGNQDLSEVKETLIKLANKLSDLQQSTTNTVPPIPNQQQQTQVQIEHQTRVETPHTSNTVLSNSMLEQRRLFNFGKRPSMSTMSKSKSAKKKKQLTYTLKFVCLASKNAVKPPTTVKERTDLSNSCLGAKSITLIENELIYDAIMEHYPQLAEVGGFDFLLYQRGSGDDAGFHVINAPHTAIRLKDLCGQAKIYIRPVQKDIPLISKSSSESLCTESEPGTQNEPSLQDSSQATIYEPVLKCFVCGVDVPFNGMREHTETHNATGHKQVQVVIV